MQYVAFCSSLVGPKIEDPGAVDYLRSLLDLRARIHVIGQEFGGVYVAEIDNPQRADDPLEDADTLLRLIRETPLLFCILGPPHHGTQIGVARTSYFEIELFQAALLQRPVHVFEFEGFSPDAQLHSVLAALRPSLRPVQWRIVRDEDELLAAVREILGRHPARAGRGWTATAALGNLATHLWRGRAREAELGGEDTPVRWLNSSFIPGDPPDPAVVAMLLAQADQQRNRELRLGRLWMALRELMGAPYTNDEFAAFLPHWSRALASWWSAASWYGLHGHAFLGPLAAGKTVADLNQRIRARPGQLDLRPFAHPAGGLASSHYSIAKLLLDHRGRRWHYEEALRQVQQGLEEGTEDRSGLHLIRGSVLFRQFKPWRARDEYATALAIRERSGAPEHEIGEALSELGFAYIFTGRLWRGRRLIQDGVKLLERSQEPGFLFRAQRKLSMANVLTGRFPAALKLRGDARRTAAESAHFDQARQV